MDHRDLVANLIAAFPRDKIPAETAKLYLQKLADVPAETLAFVVHDLICTSERFPTIATIRRAVAERTLSLPTEAEALSQVEARAAWREGKRPAVHPVVRDALRLVGGVQALRTAENPSVFRGQLLRLYRDAREAEIRDVQTGSLRALESGRPTTAVSCP